MPASTVLDLSEGKLHVLTEGERGDAVLLLSGGGADNALLSWRHLIPALAQRHRVVAFDWPKQGMSRPWAGLADRDGLLRCITDVLDHFGIEETSLVGLSQGGAMSLDFAISHPSRVRKVVVLAPAGILWYPPVVHQTLWVTAKLDPIVSRVTSLTFRSRGMVAWFAKRGLFAGPVADFDDIVGEIQEEVRTHGAGATDYMNHSIGFLRMRWDLRPRLHEISCPTLFIQGDKDVAVKAKRTIAAAGQVPGARLEILPGHGHWSNRQSPELVNRLIVDFLETSPVPAAPGGRG